VIYIYIYIHQHLDCDNDKDDGKCLLHRVEVLCDRGEHKVKRTQKEHRQDLQQRGLRVNPKGAPRVNPSTHTHTHTHSYTQRAWSREDAKRASTAPA